MAAHHCVSEHVEVLERAGRLEHRSEAGFGAAVCRPPGHVPPFDDDRAGVDPEESDTQASSVDFPAPFGPISTSASPARSRH